MEVEVEVGAAHRGCMAMAMDARRVFFPTNPPLGKPRSPPRTVEPISMQMEA